MNRIIILDEEVNERIYDANTFLVLAIPADTEEDIEFSEVLGVFECCTSNPVLVAGFYCALRQQIEKMEKDFPYLKGFSNDYKEFLIDLSDGGDK